jgi:hypothetical protein
MNYRRQVSLTEYAELPSLDINASDELFAAIDGQTLASGSGDWHLQVCGIHPDARGCWLQVHLQGREELDATLLVDPREPAAILREFGGWLESASC